jgi:hypothetical protein
MEVIPLRLPSGDDLRRALEVWMGEQPPLGPTKTPSIRQRGVTG